MPRRLTQSDLDAALPDVSSTLHLSDLHRPVDIYRDPWGIPHIRAEDEHDLFFAQGFATAQDRLWHMDFDRHQALGRVSEFIGKQGVVRDRLLRAGGMGRTAKGDYEVASQEAQAMVDAYTAGVNAFISTTRALPVEYAILDREPKPWEPWHCPTAYKMRNTLMGTFEPKLFRTRLLQKVGPANVAKLFRGYPTGHLLTVPPGASFDGPQLDGLEDLSRAASEVNWIDETDPGSNAWSISGSRTSSGLPLMGGDSHRGLDTPSVYYQIHLTCPDFSIIGHSVPGMPGVMHFCHNEHVGWGMTYGNADTQDLFLERFRETPNGREYLFMDEWREAEVLREEIVVRDSASVPVEITITHHGPVIAGEPSSGSGVAISDPGLLAPTPWMDAARDALRCTSVDELHRAFEKWTDRVNNYAVVDVAGNFGYIHEGKIPIRPQANGWTIVPGWTGDHEWEGYIPHDELPRAINPEAGYAITCNQRVADQNYPYYIGLYFSPDYRARRIQSQILDLQPGTATVGDMAGIHADRLSTPARDLCQALPTESNGSDPIPKVLSLLKAWDGSMDRELVAPTIYAQARLCILGQVLKSTLGEDVAGWLLSGSESGKDWHIRLVNLEINLGIQRGDTSLLGNYDGGWEKALDKALEHAVAILQERLGEDIEEWKWGSVHHTHPLHPLAIEMPELADALNPPSLPVHGDGDVPLAGSYAVADPFVATGLSVNRYIHDPSDWQNSRWIVPLGSSGHPASPHYADQAEAWSNVDYIPQLWDWNEIESGAETHQRLTAD